MLYLCVLAELGILLAYALCGIMPFTVPISLLGEPGDRSQYHLLLGVLTLVWGYYLTHCWKYRFLPETLCAGGIGFLLVVLQLVTNESAGHDGFAADLVVLTSVMTVRIAHRLGRWSLLWLSLLSLLASSTLFTRNMTLIGLGENVVSLAAFIVLTVDSRITPETSPRTWRVRDQIPRSLSRWPSGIVQGSFWSLTCLLIIGMSNAIQDGGLAGPIIIAGGWCGGYLAWFDELSIWLRLSVLTISVVLTLGLLSALSSVSLQLETLIPICFLFSVSYALIFLVDAHSP